MSKYYDNIKGSKLLLEDYKQRLASETDYAMYASRQVREFNNLLKLTHKKTSKSKVYQLKLKKLKPIVNEAQQWLNKHTHVLDELFNEGANQAIYLIDQQKGASLNDITEFIYDLMIMQKPHRQMLFTHKFKQYYENDKQLRTMIESVQVNKQGERQ